MLIADLGNPTLIIATFQRGETTMQRFTLAVVALSILLWVNESSAQQRGGQGGNGGRTGNAQTGNGQNRGGGQQGRNGGLRRGEQNQQRGQGQGWQGQRGQGQRGQGQGQGGRGQGMGSSSSGRFGSLTEQDARGLSFMREEEKLARDVYLTLGEQWKTPIFANISQAESRHMSAISRLMSRYKIQDPVVFEARGQFQNERLAALYQDLVAEGMRSEADAIRVGIKVEELDIADLQTEIGRVTNNDIRKTYERLLRASRQHLRAFSN